MDNGWIKLHRKIQDWEWYHNSEMVHLFLHFLLLANHEPGKWQGQQIDTGQFITGRIELSQKTGISQQTIRTCIARLKSTNEITVKSTNKFSIITLVKWKDYQIKGQSSTTKSTSQLTNDQPTTNQQLTTNKKNKEYKNDKEEERGLTPTPSNIAKDFFNNEEKRRELGIALATKHNADIQLIAFEIRKFTLYWTELNKSGTRQRWETEKTFEVGRRLEKWFSNIKQFNKPNEKKGVSI